MGGSAAARATLARAAAPHSASSEVSSSTPPKRSASIAHRKSGRYGVRSLEIDAHQHQDRPHSSLGERTPSQVEGAGHWVQQEQAEVVNQLLIGFLKNIDKH